MAYNIRKIPPTTTTTHQGGLGFRKDPRIELYSTMSTSLLSGDSFYESQDARVKRIRELINTISPMANGDKFLIGLSVYTRDQMYLRTGPSMLISEMFLAKVPGTNKAALAVWQRGDEHLDSLAYLKTMNMVRPKALLKTIAQKLNSFSPYQAVKYACANKEFTQRDALRLSHPIPKDMKQSTLFKYITQGWDTLSDAEKGTLPDIIKLKDGESFTWEQHISVNGSTKETWEQIIPKMGYMALIRNLRNFIEKGISNRFIDQVATTLSDPEQVKRARQLPWRYWNAYQALTPCPEGYGKTAFGRAIRKALDLSIHNVPDLEGNTLVLVDVSGSMSNPLVKNEEDRKRQSQSNQKVMQLMEVGAMLGSIVSMKISGELGVFGDRYRAVNFGAGDDVMSRISQCGNPGVGHGTAMGHAFDEATKHYTRKFARAIILTDCQACDNVWNHVSSYQKIHPDFKAYTINLQGYAPTCLPSGHGCYELSGFSDKLFNWMKEEEATGPSIIQKLEALGNEVLNGTYSRFNKVISTEEGEDA